MTAKIDKAVLQSQIRERVKGDRRYNPHGTHRMEELAGLKLANFKHRFWAFVIDWAILGIVMAPFGSLLGSVLERIYPPQAIPTHNIHIEYQKPDPANPSRMITTTKDIPAEGVDNVSEAERKKKDLTKEIFDPVFGLLYYGLFVWMTNGRTPGKKLMSIRVVSLVQPRVTLWQSCERALGYGASALEAGFGFFQFFIYSNRTCLHDRIAETIVIEDPPRDKKAAKAEAELVHETAQLEAEQARAMDEEIIATGQAQAISVKDEAAK